jgi:hypothetical protein
VIGLDEIDDVSHALLHSVREATGLFADRLQETLRPQRGPVVPGGW